MGSTPYILRCAKCRKGREYDAERYGYDNLSQHSLKVTGLVKNHRGRRCNLKIQVKHDGLSPRTLQYCGHVFWSKHPEALRLLRHFHPEKCSPEYYSRHHVGGT